MIVAAVVLAMVLIGLVVAGIREIILDIRTEHR
jgi:hypothetical protein